MPKTECLEADAQADASASAEAAERLEVKLLLRRNRRDLACLAILCGLMTYLFWPSIQHMVHVWATDGNSGHGYVVPFISVFLVWRRRHRLPGLRASRSNLGLVVFICGLLLCFVASIADVEFIGPVSLWVCLVGLLHYTLGREFIRELRFPLGFLLFMIPWPDFLTEAISFPLQLWSTKITVMMAGMCGLPASCDGTSMRCKDLAFQVVAACSGVRSMVILLAIGAVFAHLLHGSIYRKLLLFFLGIPIALAANVIRLFSIILVGLWLGQEIASTVFHEWTSPILFLLCSALLLGVWLLLECKQESNE